MGNGVILQEECVLGVIDIQAKLAPVIANRNGVLRNSRILIQAAKVLGVPVVLTEQYPQGLGPTVEELQPHLEGVAPIVKTTFGCFGCPEFVTALEAFEAEGRQRLVLCGVESHVCVLQTALDALERGVQVVVVGDAVGSRADSNRELALSRVRQAGGVVASTEMVVMEWLGHCRHPRFKDVLELIK